MGSRTCSTGSLERIKWTRTATIVLVAVGIPLALTSIGQPSTPSVVNVVPESTQTVTSLNRKVTHVQVDKGSYADITTEESTVTITTE